MSRFRKISHVIWHCQYHIVWVPKYRYRMLDGVLKEELRKSLHLFCGQKSCEILELNIQKEHVHMIVMVPPKVSISDLPPLGASHKPPFGWPRQSHVLWAWIFTRCKSSLNEHSSVNIYNYGALINIFYNMKE